MIKKYIYLIFVFRNKKLKKKKKTNNDDLAKSNTLKRKLTPDLNIESLPKIKLEIIKAGLTNDFLQDQIRDFATRQNKWIKMVGVLSERVEAINREIDEHKIKFERETQVLLAEKKTLMNVIETSNSALK